MKNLTESVAELKNNSATKYQEEVHQRDVEIALLKDIVKSTKTVLRAKDQDIKKMKLKLQNVLTKINKEFGKKKMENERGAL